MSMPHFISLSEEQSDRYKSPNGVGELGENVGPCPRDILQYTRDPEDFERMVKRDVVTLEVEAINDRVLP